jgi:hypothetical protein
MTRSEPTEKGFRERVFIWVFAPGQARRPRVYERVGRLPEPRHAARGGWSSLDLVARYGGANVDVIRRVMEIWERVGIDTATGI